MENAKKYLTKKSMRSKIRSSALSTMSKLVGKYRYVHYYTKSVNLSRETHPALQIKPFAFAKKV